MNRRIIAGLAAAVTTLTALGVSSPAAAAEPPAGQYRLRVDNRVCTVHDDTSIDIGGSLYVQEIGKHGVQQIRVKYVVKPVVSSGTAPELRSKTKESLRFPDDAASYHFHDAGWNGSGRPRADANAQLWYGVANYYNGLRLTAKVTWDRSRGRQDWNRTVLVAQCG